MNPSTVTKQSIGSISGVCPDPEANSDQNLFCEEKNWHGKSCSQARYHITFLQAGKFRSNQIHCANAKM